MKLFLSIISFLSLLSLTAETAVWQDNAKKSTWVAADKKSAVTLKNGILFTSDKSYFLGENIKNINPDGENLPGNKLKFSVEARGKGIIQLGIWNYQGHIRQKWSEKITLTEQFKTYSVEYTLTDFAPSVRCLLKGAGEFRNLKLLNMRKEDYRISASPAYQMYSVIPEKVTFTLLKNGVPVPDAKLKISSDSASDPFSGAVAKAYAQKGDTTLFDAAAKKIKLSGKTNILYLGDSLTHFAEGYNHADKTVFFLNKYNSNQAVLFNFAVRGDTSSMTFDRMRDNYKDRFTSRFAGFKKNKYDIAFIFLGQNDTRAHVNKNYKEPFVSPLRQEKNYRGMIKILKQMGVKRIIIISCASLDEPRLEKQAKQLAKTRPKKHSIYGKPAFLENFNAVSKKLAAELGVEYLDIYDTMKSLPDKPSYFIDGVHLSDKGHNFVALKTLEYLAENSSK